MIETLEHNATPEHDSDVSTTMIYTHVVKRGAAGAISPLDRMQGANQ